MIIYLSSLLFVFIAVCNNINYNNNKLLCGFRTDKSANDFIDEVINV